MIIDSKGRIFCRINILDLAISIIIILGAFVAVKFMFFRPEFFHYERVVFDAEFTNVSLADLAGLKEGKNLLYPGNDSYLIMKRGDTFTCFNEDNAVISYSFNDSYSVGTKHISIHDFKEYICNGAFLLDVTARRIDDSLFYESHYVHEGEHLAINVDGSQWDKGNVVRVYNGAEEGGDI